MRSWWSITAPPTAAPIPALRVSRRSSCWRSRETSASAAAPTPASARPRNDIVVLLNSDMRVAPDFLAPLLEGFADPAVFAVSCQIFFSDPASCAKKPA